MSQLIEYNENEICCICLDETNNKNSLIESFCLQCCNGIIHKKCLLILILHNFNACPLCRTKIDTKLYYNISMLNNYLTLDDLEKHKKNVYYLLSEISSNKIIYYINIIQIELRLIIIQPKKIMIGCFKILCILFGMSLLIYTLCSIILRNS